MPGGIRLWAGALVVLATVVAVVWLSEPPPDPMRPGQPAPPFELPRLATGESLALEDLRGRVVLLNFWATWCKPCEEEMPAMQRLYEALGGPGFELVAISVDDGEAEVEAFRDRLGITFPILWDPQKRVSRAYQTYRYPETYLIDRDGTLLARYVGPRDWDAAVYHDRIRKLVAGTPGAAAPP